MSELHQYEIHFVERIPSEVLERQVELEWAYSASDALVQFAERCRFNGRTVNLKEIGPVKAAVKNRNFQHLTQTHFHVCGECQTVVSCFRCETPEFSRYWDSCIACKGKKPHDHHCPICKDNYPCPTIPCSSAHCRDFICQKHTKEEKREYYNQNPL